MLRKVVSLLSSYPSNHACDKTAPEPEVALNSEPERKPNPEPELKLNEEPEEEVDPIAMLAALPKASRRKDRFNPKLSPIKEEEGSECMLSEREIAYTRHEGWVKSLKKQFMCMDGTHFVDMHKVDNGELEDEKLPFRVVVFVFKPKCGALPKPNHSLSALSKLNHSFNALSKPNHRLSPDIISSLKILKVRYMCRPSRHQDKELILSWHKKK